MSRKKDRASVGTALTAGVASLVAFSLPFQLGLMVAALAAICAGILAETRIRTNGESAEDGVQATPVARRTQNVTLTIATGMAILLSLQVLIS